MSEREAIEMRIKSLQSQINKLGVMLAQIGVFNMVLLAGLFTGWVETGLLAGVVLLLVGTAGLVLTTRAQEQDGFARRFCERIRGEYDDPPLNQWAESLEKRNAFPVDGENNE